MKMDSIKKKICNDVLKELFDYYIENFAEEKNDFFEYKDEAKFAAIKYLTEKGKILPRRITRLNAKDQRILTRLIKKARHSGILPFQAS